MKVGSLVVVKPFIHLITDKVKPWIKWLPVGDESTVYTIKDLPYNELATLEEGIIGYTPKGEELCISTSVLREIQSPEDGMEVVEEMLAENLELVA